jgi:hypothetical protein
MLYSPFDYELPFDFSRNYSYSQLDYNLNPITYEWTDKELRIYYNSKLKETVQHNWGQTPFIRLYIDENNNNIGESFLKDIADLNRVLYNILSSSSYETINSAFSSLVYPWTQKYQKLLEGLIPQKTIMDLDGNVNKELILDPQKVMFAPEGQFPQWLNRDISSLDIQMAYMQYLEGVIGKLAGRRMSEMLERSGIAEAYHFQSFNAQLNTLARIMENFETVVFQTILDYLGDDREFIIEYPTNFDIIDNKEKVSQIISYLDRQDITETGRAIAKRKLSNVVLNPTKEEMEQINIEIDAGIMDTGEENENIS